ncbi:MAG: hypothetical protein ACLGIZ_16385 [Acidimicrobiia bacterium]
MALLGLAGQLVLAGGSPAQAQEPASAGIGSGRAAAKYLRVGPSRGSLSLAPTVGLALSDFLNTRGRGDVRTVDLAALEDSIPVEVREQLPSLKVESTDEGAENGKTTSLGTPAEVPVGLSAAELNAAAGPAPFGRSSFRTAPIDLGVVRIAGGTAAASSGVVDGTVRESIARVRIGSVDIGDGALLLEGLQWEAVQRSGGASEEVGRFTVGSITVAGQRFATPEGAEQPLADAIAAAAPALKPLGLQIDLPRARIEAGLVEMTPLRIRVAGSEVGKLVGPVVEAAQPVRDAVVDAIRGGTEDADAVLLLGDVALGVLAGGSRLDIELGGVTAQTAAPAERFTFGAGSGGFDLSGGGASTAGMGTGRALPRPSLGASGSAPTLGKVPASASAPTGTSSDDVAAPATAPVRSSSSGSGPAGPLLPIGLATAGLALAAGTVDYRRLLRRPLPA